MGLNQISKDFVLNTSISVKGAAVTDSRSKGMESTEWFPLAWWVLSQQCPGTVFLLGSGLEGCDSAQLNQECTASPGNGPRAPMLCSWDRPWPWHWRGDHCACALPVPGGWLPRTPSRKEGGAQIIYKFSSQIQKDFPIRKPCPLKAGGCGLISSSAQPFQPCLPP